MDTKEALEEEIRNMWRHLERKDRRLPVVIHFFKLKKSIESHESALQRRIKEQDATLRDVARHEINLDRKIAELEAKNAELSAEVEKWREVARIAARDIDESDALVQQLEAFKTKVLNSPRIKTEFSDCFCVPCDAAELDS